MLSSESAIKKITYQNKQLKTEQLLNQSFSPENYLKWKPSKFQYYMVCQLGNLIYYLHACYTILYPEGMGSGIQAIS